MFRSRKVFFLFSVISAITFAQSFNTLLGTNEVETIIGPKVTDYLKLHYNRMPLNDDVSKKALKKFLEKLDYNKNFLLQSDVKKFSKYELKFDYFIKKGTYPVVDLAMKIKTDRIKKADAVREKIFKKQFDFTKDETFENDRDKRNFVKSEKDFEKRWRKVFKQATLSRYASIIEDQKSLKEDIEKKKNEKKSGKKTAKKEKKSKKKEEKEEVLTDKQMLKKAHEAISKNYKRYFERELQEDRMAYISYFINSITEIYDPHTSYLAPKKREDFNIDMSGSLQGIGAILSEDEGYIKVVKIVPGGPAWRGKELEAEDVILSVSEKDGDPVDLVGMRVDNAVRYIRGPKGKTVKLYVKKGDGSRKTIAIVRDVVKIGESFTKSSVLEKKNLDMKIGYINVPKFYREFGGSVNCTDDVVQELRRLKKTKVDGVILDLRNNGGGALEDAIYMSGLFIEKGPIVQVKDYSGSVQVLPDRDPTVEYDGPLIVMTNRFSASASEILAAALQDYGRAVIVGAQNSHGKGTVQVYKDFDREGLTSIMNLGLGAIKYTNQMFYRINGGSTQHKGVVPDIILPDQFSYLENRESDLDYSLKWDKVYPLNYKKWEGKKKLDYQALRLRSGKRVSENKRYKKINENINYLLERKKDTVASLNLEKWLKENEEAKKISEKYKETEENENLKVSNFEASLKSHETVKPGEEKQWKEEFKQRKEEWVTGLRKDVELEEAMYIMADIIEQTTKKVVYAPVQKKAMK